MNRFKTSPTHRRLIFAVGTLCAQTLAAGSSLAQPEGAPTGSDDACQAKGNSLSELGCELSRSISLERPTLVVAGTPIADAPVSRPDELASRVARVVSGSLGGRARHHGEPADLARAQSLAREPGTLLYLSIEIAHGKIRVTADVYGVKKKFWDRVRDRAPTPSQHGFAERPLDSELRSFLPFVPVVAKVTHQAVPPERAPVALACGDADGDGSSEIAFVGRHRIFLGRIEGKRFVTHAEKSWAALSPVAPSPLKEPIAAAWFRPDGSLDLGSSDRADFLRLDAALEPVARAERRIPWAGACLAVEETALSPKPMRCLKDDAAPDQRELEAPPDGVATEERREQHRAVAARDAVNGEVTIRSTGNQGLLGQAGAQLAVADLNGDGKVELLTSHDTHDASRDLLTIHTLTGGGKLERKVRLPVNEGITALAVCPQPSQGLAPILVGTRGRLWVVQ